VNDIVQGTPEWFAARLGKVTASRVADVIAITKSGFGASRSNYMAQLVAERLTGVPTESFTNSAMSWGTEKEPEARSAYEFMRDAEVVEIGFVQHPTIKDSGASPDGLVGEHGMVEIKAPLTATHIDTLIGKAIDKKYVVQMQWQMACACRAWCDFVSYDPRLPAAMQLFVQRVRRDDVMIADLEKSIRAFLAELDEKIAKLNSIYGAPEPTNLLMAG
jgi:putative phage-type endonuclease